MTVRFVAVGLDYRHIWNPVGDLLAAGAGCAGWWPSTSDPLVVAGLRKRFPELPLSRMRRRCWRTVPPR